MNLIRKIFSLIRRILFRRRIDDDLAYEIQEHMREKIEELMAQGASAREAALAARREFGNVTLIEESGREVWRWRFVESVLADLRYGARQLRRTPGFTFVALVTLGLGIGVNTALFSVVNGVLLSPLAYPDAEQLVTLHESKANFQTGSISFPNFLDWQKDNSTFSGMAAARQQRMSLTGAGDAEQVSVDYITSDLFRVLGMKPVIGRDLEAGEDRIGGPPIALIGAGMWNSRYRSSVDVLGKTLTLDGKSFTIVGVVPGGFEPFDTVRESEVYLPMGQWTNNLLANRAAGLGIHGIGRLKPGVSIEQARANMKEVTSNLAAAYINDDKDIGAALIPLKERMLGRVRPILIVLLAAVGFVLLIACVNVANLMLARSNSRAREFAVRAAIGAGQMRLIRQLLTESVLLGGSGGSIGLILAGWGTKAALTALQVPLPRTGHIALDRHVLVFTAVVSLLAGVTFGLVPALKIARSPLVGTLKETGRSFGAARHRTQRVLVVMEVALALVLLIGAGLMIRTMAALWNVNPGFDPHNVMTFGLALPPSTYKQSADTIRESYRNFNRELMMIPGVQAVSASWGAMPLNGDDEQLFWMDGQPRPSSPNDMNWALSYVVEPDYLSVMRIPLKRGRFFTDRDNLHSPLVAVVDEVLAADYFQGEDPIGKKIVLDGPDSPAEIIGVVGHVKQWAIGSEDGELQAQMYRPFGQLADAQMASFGAGYIVRSDGKRPGLFDAIRETSRRMSTDQIVSGVSTMEELIVDALARVQFAMVLLASFAALALMLAAVGISGVVAHWVGQRTPEIGVRIALGADRGRVLKLILVQAASMAAIGIAAGLIASFGLTRLIANLLYGVSAADPLTFAAIAAVLMLVSLAACYIPARRATKVDPIVALRHE